MLQIAPSTALRSYQSKSGRMPSLAGTLRGKPGGRTMRLLVIFTALIICLSGPSGVFAQPADPTPQQIYERFAATVVFVVATPDHGTGMGGTGSIIRPDGLILTNAHVVVDSTDHR